MPATRPHDAEPTGDPDVTLHRLENPFTLHYDKLIIAVGAYSQSELLGLFLYYFSSPFFSVQYTWCKRTRAFPQGREGRPQNSRAYS